MGYHLSNIWDQMSCSMKGFQNFFLDDRLWWRSEPSLSPKLLLLISNQLDMIHDSSDIARSSSVSCSDRFTVTSGSSNLRNRHVCWAVDTSIIGWGTQMGASQMKGKSALHLRLRHKQDASWPQQWRERNSVCLFNRQNSQAFRGSVNRGSWPNLLCSPFPVCHRKGRT